MSTPQISQFVDQLLDTVINRTIPVEPYQGLISSLARQVHDFECRATKVVIFGGGTGLSTVIGGNSRLEDWPQNPFVGLKQDFPYMNVVVCTTDDGGSTGRLLQQLPMIGIGDFRKILLSMILQENLQAAYGLDNFTTRQLIHIIHSIFNHRFQERSRGFRYVVDPILLVPRDIRKYCPEPLAGLLSSLGKFISPGGEGPVIAPGGHCLGNLILTAAIFRSGAYMFHPYACSALSSIHRGPGCTPLRPTFLI